mmetsp:Transcript_4967/g.6850  ORF Transcript_4967/g.6850 Transcript_4967/m.6850 type:complete len:102 (-) Transcript_4967:278-583(-)
MPSLTLPQPLHHGHAILLFLIPNNNQQQNWDVEKDLECALGQGGNSGSKYPSLLSTLPIASAAIAELSLHLHHQQHYLHNTTKKHPSPTQTNAKHPPTLQN